MVHVPIDINKAIRKESERRRFSPMTTKTYLYCVNKFLVWCGKDLSKVSKKDVRLFLEELNDRGLSGNTMNTYHMAIKFLFEQVMRRGMSVDIKYSKMPERLPVVLSKGEVKKLFSSVGNDKHKLMVMLMYGAGLRVSELVNLRVGDLEMDRGFGYVRSGKGNKDRMFIVPEKLKESLKDLILESELKSDSYLFCSNRDSKYSARTLQTIVRKVSRKAKISKRVSCHTLRHSFATHLIEDGYNVGSVQSLLGHKSPETTMIYVHTATKNMINVKSPIDSLYL
jgi:integrase/recombinase XerD